MDEYNDGPGALLTDRVALITGGAGAIGAATARLFARHGAHVIIVDNSERRTPAVVDEITRSGGSSEGHVLDVRDPAALESLKDRVLADHGRLDVLVNNVGHYVKFHAAFEDTTEDHWQAIYEVNYLHVLRMTHLFLPSMIERRSGSIINVSSVEGLRGYPLDPVYGAIKAAVVQFTKSVGVQAGHHGVRVNGVGPDVTESIQVPYSKFVPPEQEHLWPIWVPVGRMGVPDDQARVMLVLASDLSVFITGHTIPTDGGTGAAGGWFRTSNRPGQVWTNRPIEAD